jgi:N-methylhydantoinase B
LRCPPWGVQGGKDGKPGWVTVYKTSGESQKLFKTKSYRIEAGDQVCMKVGGGGGYGSPSRRPREKIERDLQFGYISHDAARRDYGFDA